jgi:transposase-like protein
LDYPEFCPNTGCVLHKKSLDFDDWYYRYGTYETKTFGTVRRYKCRKCGKTFSEQTFSIDYYAKKAINYEELLKKLISTSSTRDISRDFNISTGTVSNKITRLSRQAIAIHDVLRKEIVLNDSLAADGLESYTVSQYYPNNLTMLLLSSSQYVYYINYTTIRRKGVMSENQKLKRKMLEKVYKPSPKGTEIAFLYLLYEIEGMNKENKPLYLYTDEKKEYVRALKRHIYGYKDLMHIKISSRKARNYQNKLFPCNYMDRQIRKDLANHVRETVCFARNVNNCMERMLIYLMYHNYIKIFREKQRNTDMRTHAEVAGIDRALIDRNLKDIYTRRRFLSLENITDSFEEVWNRMLITPLKTNPDYLPAYAVA